MAATRAELRILFGDDWRAPVRVIDGHSYLHAEALPALPPNWAWELISREARDLLMHEQRDAAADAVGKGIYLVLRKN